MRHLAALLIMASVPALAAPAGTPSTGRFQVIQEQHADRYPEHFMLDTQTGKIWRQSCMNGADEACLFSAWMAEAVEGVTLSLAEIEAVSAKTQEALGPYKTPAAPKEHLRRKIVPTH